MKSVIKTILVSVLATASLSTTVIAQEQAKASGEVRRIDAAKGKIAIKHGAISDFKLPAMTLVYEISPALIATVKAGDKVKFTATHENNRYRIDEIKVDN